MTLSITKRLEFDAAHRLVGHNGKCANLHGHHYVVDVTLSGDTDSLGRVVDFYDVKKLCADLISKLDHQTLVGKTDIELAAFIQSQHDRGMHPKGVLILPGHTTVETIAYYVYSELETAMRSDERFVRPFRYVRLDKVNVFETPTCSAEFKRVGS